MPAHVQEWLNLLVRWAHVIAAIMWIGDSFLFMWLDSHLSRPTRQREGAVVGELWMTHSGGFYEVVKRKSLGRDELPPNLYWFKWESYTTWISGFLLLVIVYQLNGAALLVDPAVSSLTHGQAVAISLAILPTAFLVYELLWRTPLAKNQRVFGVVGLGLITGLAWALTQIFSARGAFLMVGATLGTVMAANVFFRIIPAQKHMLAMTREGKPVDTSYGQRAKGRSIQNHYLTLPVLFTMVSNHFPSTYGHSQPWLVLALLIVFGAGLKYVMNHRTRTHPVAAGGTVLALATVLFLARPVSPADAAALAYQSRPQVSFATVKAIVDARCTSCHAAHPSSPMFPAAPLGIALESPEDLRRHAERVFVRATATRTMPLANMTGMTDEERELLGAWFVQGAEVNAPGPVQLVAAPPAAAALAAGATGSAGAPQGPEPTFQSLCASCHGAAGKGDGVAAAALTPRPRNFSDPQWQKSVTDAQIRKAILEGGLSVGKSPLMPPNPTLAEKPQTLDALVRQIRSFGQEVP